jgi:hypothetical protein
MFVFISNKSVTNKVHVTQSLRHWVEGSNQMVSYAILAKTKTELLGD